MECPDIMDIEASGFGCLSYPIEVGYCLSSQERYCALIKPHPTWVHWDKGAEAVHGIAQSLLHDVGLEPGEVCIQLNKRLSGRVLYSDAWVADKAWLNRLYEVSPLQPSFQLCAIENIQNECQHLIWDKVRDRQLKEAKFVRHRASADAQFIQGIFQQSRDICQDQGRDTAVFHKLVSRSKN